ncbi:MAG: BamA/TamA family outer membrane protein [Muribaculaceae bacterium]|nr:BamA/TamA family outer membrane protein [Muribaculaceae bacterium]
MKMNKHHITYISALGLLVLSMLCACSTTRRIPDGEMLYTGLKKFEVQAVEPGQKLPAGVVSDVKAVGNVKPNNPMPFMSPYVRTPFPIGLWVYNNMSDSASGIKKWIYNHLAKKPVLVSGVKPQLRVKMMESILDNNGYFGSTANYTIVQDKKNPKKARINYDVRVGEPYLIDSLIYFEATDQSIFHYIDSLALRDPYLQVGERFSTDSLSIARTRITNSLRNRGFYYFRPEYIEFLADSTITRHRIALKLSLAEDTPPLALRRWKMGDVTVYVERNSTSDQGTPDTILDPKATVIVMRPAKLKKGLIPSCITFRKGRNFSVRNMDATQTRLSRLGIFSNIDMQVYPSDTLLTDDKLNVDITCRFDKPMEASLEVNATSKSNSYLGPGLIFGFTDKNVFGGAEQLSLKLNASYEWQTGHGRSSVFNSYEFGLSASLAFPRLLAPRFIPRTHRELNWTRVTLNGDLLNRPHYFKMAQFGAGISYEWRATRHTLHQFTPLKLTYTKLLHTTPEFDSIMNANPAIAESFKSQYIPMLSYTYTLDKFLERDRINGITFTATLSEAGNIFSGIYALCGVKGEKKLFGTPFSQFVKGQAQLVYSRRLFKGKDQWIVSRILIGAAHAYGNSTEVPYSEQFYIGGANSIRAFTVRSIGPGSYRAPADQINGYFDQTGTFKLEANVEYRFPIYKFLHGAVFLDAGNIWLLKNDSNRPGGKLEGKTFLRDIALGTGVGLRADLGMIVIRGDLGYGLHAPYYFGHYFNIPFRHAFAFHLAIGYPF